MENCKSCSNEVYLWLGLTALVVGAVFLLEGLGYIPEGTSSFVWPALMVFMGIKFILLGCANNSCCGCCDSCEWEEMPSMPAKKAAPSKSKKAKKK